MYFYGFYYFVIYSDQNKTDTTPQAGAQLLDSLISSALKGTVGNLKSSQETCNDHSSDRLDQRSSETNFLNNLLGVTAKEGDNKAALSSNLQGFYKTRQLLFFIVGIIVRLSLLTTFGAQYVQVSIIYSSKHAFG